ncbi:translation elongation factor Ts [Rickettsiales bacterium LUAb2]
MSNITAELIKTLREKTSAGMVDCKKALTECSGDLSKAEDWLKEKGLSVAQKKAGRVAAEGLVAALVNNKLGVIVEVNSETDFVSKNQEFIDFVKKVSDISIKCNSLEDLQSATYEAGVTVNDALVNLIAKIKENLLVRKFAKVEANKGELFSYVHAESAPGLGRIAVLLNLDGAGDLADLGKKLCMHIAAFSPKALDRSAVDSEIVENERKIQQAIVAETKKPQEIMDKMLEGKMNKFFQEICLLEQAYLMDDSKSVSTILKNNNATIVSYVRIALGEDVEKKEENFAEEVAKAMNG